MVTSRREVDSTLGYLHKERYLDASMLTKLIKYGSSSRRAYKETPELSLSWDICTSSARLPLTCSMGAKSIKVVIRLWPTAFRRPNFCRHEPPRTININFPCPTKKNTLLRVIPTLAFQLIYSDIYFDILPNILSDIYSDILSGISSSILSGI
jgi:hypothetical protein